MGNRKDVQKTLEELLNIPVYFQPPETLKLTYPCLIYSMEAPNLKRANDYMYKQNNRYTLTLIDKDEESLYSDKLLTLPYVSPDRNYISDFLYHYVFTLYK